MTRDRIRAQRGISLMVACLLLVALLGIAALCIDLGVLYTARTSAQHAADAAALAGAFTFVNSPTASQPAAAQQAAIAVAATNIVLGKSVTITASNVVVDTVNRRVNVAVSLTGSNSVGIFFGKALGVASVPVQTQAMAQASATAISTDCIKPVYLPNTIFSALTPAAACATNPPQVIFDSNHNLSSWATQNGAFRFAGSCNLIRPTSPGGALTPSQFYSLDFGSGANTYRSVWSSCLNNASGATTTVVSCGDSVPVKTGNMNGPTNQGVNDLTGTPPDTWLGPNPTTGVFEYQTANGVADTSRSLGVVAVYDNCSQTITSGTHGQAANVIGFVEIFVDGMADSCSGSATGGSSVRAHAVNATGCSNGSGGSSSGPFAVPVQLVKQ